MRDSILAPSSNPHPGCPPPAARPDRDGAALTGPQGRTRPRERKTLTRTDWTVAALEALARDGLRAVAVEPLAERLGATKGSFYWHFRDRNALLEAAVAHWERTATDELISRLESFDDPQERHDAAIGWVAGSERDMQIFIVLLWNADHPLIGPAVHRILAKRMAFSLRLREQLGEDAEQARTSMVYAYSVLLGLQLLRRATPHLVPQGGTPDGAPQGLCDYVASLIRQAAGIPLPAAF